MGNELVYGIGGLVVGAAAGYYISSSKKAGAGGTEIPAEVLTAIDGIIVKRVADGINLVPKGIFNFQHDGGKGAILIAWVANGAGEKDNPEAVMSAWNIGATTYRLEFSQTAASDIEVWLNGAKQFTLQDRIEELDIAI